MAASSSKNFELDVAEYIEEAFERCGLELRTAYDLKTAKRSLNLLLAEWANRGLNQWTISQTAIALTQGTTSYSLDATNPTAVIDVSGCFYPKNNQRHSKRFANESNFKKRICRCTRQSITRQTVSILCRQAN
jgi:hypothetical protein